MEYKDSSQTQPAEVEGMSAPASPSLMRTLMFMLTLFGFWIYGPIGVFFTYVSALSPLGGGDSGLVWIAWVVRITVILLFVHAAYAFLTSPWETRGPGYIGYVVNCVALLFGASLLVLLASALPELELFSVAFGSYR